MDFQPGPDVRIRRRRTVIRIRVRHATVRIRIVVAPTDHTACGEVPPFSPFSFLLPFPFSLSFFLFLPLTFFFFTSPPPSSDPSSSSYWSSPVLPPFSPHPPCAEGVSPKSLLPSSPILFLRPLRPPPPAPYTPPRSALLRSSRGRPAGTRRTNSPK